MFLVNFFADVSSGIPEHAREKIFEPFYTTKEVGKGTGLGMSISYNIIKDFKGSLNFDAEEGIGTAFKVALPSKEAIKCPSINGYFARYLC